MVEIDKNNNMNNNTNNDSKRKNGVKQKTPLALRKNLKMLRAKSRKSIRVIAHDLGITYSYYGAIEAGTRNVGLDLLVKIAKYYNVSYDFLMGENPSITEEPKIKEITSIDDYKNELRKEICNIANEINEIKDFEEIITIMERIVKRNYRNEVKEKKKNSANKL